MAAKKQHQAVLRKLKKQIIALQKKEEAARAQLRVALMKVKKLGKAFKRELDLKAKHVKAKVAAAESELCIKIANDIEHRLKKQVVAKTKAMSSAIEKFEKQFATGLAKAIKSKAKKIKKR